VAWGGAFARVGFVLEDGGMGIVSLSGKGSLFLAWLLYIYPGMVSVNLLVVLYTFHFTQGRGLKSRYDTHCERTMLL
jgi:hypothetical protein